MKNTVYAIARTGLLIASVPLLLAACSSVSKGIQDDGKSAQEIIFPDSQKNGWMKEGTYPNSANLKQVAAGQTKEQIRALLGSPQFAEGLAGVREWDYLFHLRQADGSVRSCQYKILFDTHYLAQSFHWSGTDCAVETAEAKPVPVVAPRETVSKRIDLSADALFAFAGGRASDLKPEGRQALDGLVQQVRGSGTLEHVQVDGYTDRIGSNPANQRLSQQRAETVRQHLVDQGLPADKITARGLGSANPVVPCAEQASKTALIACLAPNRRVEILVTTRASS